MAGLIYKNADSQKVFLSGTAYVNPTHGTARLCVKTGSASTATAKYGFTSNSSATQYCGLRIKLNNGIAYIGRSETKASTISTTSSTTLQTNTTSATSTTSLKTQANQSTNTYTASKSVATTAMVSMSGYNINGWNCRYATVAVASTSVAANYTSGFTRAATNIAKTGVVSASGTGMNEYFYFTNAAINWTNTATAVKGYGTATRSSSYSQYTATSYWTTYSGTYGKTATFNSNNATKSAASAMVTGYVGWHGNSTSRYTMTSYVTQSVTLGTTTNYWGTTYAIRSIQTFCRTTRAKSGSCTTSVCSIYRSITSSTVHSGVRAATTATTKTYATHTSRLKTSSWTPGNKVSTASHKTTLYYSGSKSRASTYTTGTTWNYTRTVARTQYNISATTSASVSTPTTLTSTSKWTGSATQTITGAVNITTSVGSTNQNYTYTKSYLTHNFNL